MNCETSSISAVWDQEAISYDFLRQKDAVYSSCIHQITRPIPKNTKLCLDAGCGTGLSTIALKSRCKAVIAIDYSFNSLEILKNKKLINVLVVQANLLSLPFKNSVFDACICANTLQHLSPNGHQETAVAELLRTMKTKSVLSISVHHYSRGKRSAGWIKSGRPGQPGIDYIFRFSRNDLLAIIPRAQIKGVGYYGFLKFPFLGRRLQNFLALFLGKIAGRLGYGHMLIAVTNKLASNVFH